ncbi:energy-coupling factor ABC transporter permease [Paenalcaligenes sp.]|uniref:energy-coupling factor ABC transporter permease n=1 Tax=Paenalcaligenes sp. TaxID=1966342 RepID=UPI0026193906|nr:energy-coupling factor ABC transporter permease [Paenalcaligenes sp.]
MVSLLVALAVTAVAAWHFDWRAFIKDTAIQQLSLICMLILVSLWMVRTGIQPGLHLHFLGLTTLALMLGWRLSLLVASVALLVSTLMGVDQWALFGMNWLYGVVWPISLSYFIFLLSYSYMPRHLFVYIFIAGFANAALTITAQMGAFALYYAWQDLYSWRVLVEDYLKIIPLMLFPEGLINGMSIATLVVYKPEWVCTFLDKDYLHKKS